MVHNEEYMCTQGILKNLVILFTGKNYKKPIFNIILLKLHHITNFQILKIHKNVLHILFSPKKNVYICI